MKRKLFIVIGALLAAAVISAGSIAVYEHFRPSRGGWDEWPLAVERDNGSSAGPSRAGGMSEGVHNGAVLPLARALEIAAGRLPGEVIKVELEREHGRSVYEIKVLADNGRVREIKFDARSGEVIEIEDD